MSIQRIMAVAMLPALLVCVVMGQQRRSAHRNPIFGSTVTPGPVIGGGTIGQLTKWIGVNGTTFDLGDANLFEDKNGNVGIGTRTPTSLLTVQGLIETTQGGYKFPDGTIQTTAAITSIFHDATLTGVGTLASPLGIAPGGVGTIQLASGAVTAPKIANGTVIRSLNGLFDNLSILAGDNISVAAGPSTLTISAPNLISSVVHDTTLAGAGSGSSPLQVAVPLTLKGLSIPNSSSVANILSTGGGGSALFVRGGFDFPISGSAIRADGGDAEVNGTGGNGGIGLDASGGDGADPGACNCISSNGGDGILATGGTTRKGFGGNGIETDGGGGSGSGNIGGSGIVATAGRGLNGATDGNAGDFVGNVDITGRLTKGAGSFKIDHPLDPENKYLYHSFVESPDMKNIYDGTVITDASGDAIVTLPTWFEALNRDFRYQLTVIGTFAQAIVAEKIRDNRFRIKTSIPNVEVSWQVTGIRQDAYANMHRIPVEEAKPDHERGTYLHPDAFNQPEEKSALMARHPAMMRRAIERRARQRSGIAN